MFSRTEGYSFTILRINSPKIVFAYANQLLVNFSDLSS
jgi:hypothetical protein